MDKAETVPVVMVIFPCLARPRQCSRLTSLTSSQLPMTSLTYSFFFFPFPYPPSTRPAPLRLARDSLAGLPPPYPATVDIISRFPHIPLISLLHFCDPFGS